MGMMNAEPEIKLTDEQDVAVSKISDWLRSPLVTELSLTGAAGTGKSFLTKYVKKLMPGATAWTAMTGKAALRLSELGGIEASTLHSALYVPPRPGQRYVSFTKVKPPECKVLVVDEASMMPPQVFEDLQQWIEQGVKVLLIGDGYQLPPVLTYKEEKAHGKDFTVFSKVRGPALTKAMRFGDDILDIATCLREKQILPREGNKTVTIANKQYPGISAIKDYLDDPADHAIITWTNRLRMQANNEIRRKLGFKEFLPTKGEPVLVCRNGQERLNGELLTVDHIQPGPVLAGVSTHWLYPSSGEELLVTTAGGDIPMDGSMPNIKDWKEFHKQRNSKKLPEPAPVTYGYTYTCHKAQGMGFRRVTVFLSGADLRNQHFNQPTTLPDGREMSFMARWTYTAATRAAEKLSIYTGT